MIEDIVSYDMLKDRLLILDDDLSSVWEDERGRGRRGGISIAGATDGGALIVSNWGFPMRKKEAKAVIELLKKGLDNYSDEEEHADIIEEVDYTNNMYREANMPQPKSKHVGYVYVIRGENGRYKIGTSENPEKRVANLCVASCEQHELLFSYKVEDPYRHEKLTHEAMNHRRKHSEWFELNDEDIEIIKTYLSRVCIEKEELK